MTRKSPSLLPPFMLGFVVTFVGHMATGAMLGYPDSGAIILTSAFAWILVGVGVAVAYDGHRMSTWWRT